MERTNMLDKIIEHYSEQYEILRNVDIAGITVPVVASMRSRGIKTIMGFATNSVGPEACEHVFMFECETFDDALLQKITGLISQAEQEYIHPGKDHAYTFLSVVALVRNVEQAAAVSLKKYKCRRDYGKGGWGMFRVLVLDENGASFCSKDGIDFKRLILKVIG